MRRVALPVLGLCVWLAGCHSAMVQATVRNSTSGPLQLIEVDYPSASFGTQGLAPGAEYRYRFKVLGSGKLKILYTDQSGKERTQDGPELHEGLEGPLLIEIAADGVRWTPKLAAAR